jgi:uncharacterized protein with GYD domain
MAAQAHEGKGVAVATYILLMNLTPEGQGRALQDPDYLSREENAIAVPGVQTLGLYAVLGQYDFVTIVEAQGNEEIARFSIELGVKANVHITTLPTVPASRLESSPDERVAQVELEASARLPEDEQRLSQDGD